LANVVKFESYDQDTESPLTPELKDFIDRAIVPILVKRYLAEQVAEDKLAGATADVAESTGKTAA
jgi:hypothetical protein